MRFRCAICDKGFLPTATHVSPFKKNYEFQLEHCGHTRFHEMTAEEIESLVEVVVFAEEAKRLRREKESAPNIFSATIPLPDLWEAAVDEPRRPYKRTLLQLKRRQAQRANGIPFRLVYSVCLPAVART